MRQILIALVCGAAAMGHASDSAKAESALPDPGWINEARAAAQLATAQANLRTSQKLLDVVRLCFRRGAATPRQLRAQQFALEWAALELAVAEAAAVSPEAARAAEIHAQIIVAAEYARSTQEIFDHFQRASEKGYVAALHLRGRHFDVQQAVLGLAAARAAAVGPESEEGARVQSRIFVAQEQLDCAQNLLEHAVRFVRRGYANRYQLEAQQFAVDQASGELIVAQASAQGGEEEFVARVRAQIATAQYNLRHAQNLLEHSERLHRKGYVATARVEAQQFAVERADWELTIARAAERGPDAVRSAEILAQTALTAKNLGRAQNWLDRSQRLARKGYTTYGHVQAQQSAVECAVLDVAIAQAAERGPAAEQAASLHAQSVRAAQDLQSAQAHLDRLRRWQRKGYVARLNVEAQQSVVERASRDWEIAQAAHTEAQTLLASQQVAPSPSGIGSVERVDDLRTETSLPAPAEHVHLERGSRDVDVAAIAPIPEPASGSD